MLFTFTREVSHAYRSKARRTWKARLDRTPHSWLCRVVAVGASHPRLFDREWTNGLLESSRHEPLAGQNGPHAGKDGSRALQDGHHARWRRLVGYPALERQPRFRRLPQRDTAPSRGRAT